MLGDKFLDLDVISIVKDSPDTIEDGFCEKPEYFVFENVDDAEMPAEQEATDAVKALLYKWE